MACNGGSVKARLKLSLIAIMLFKKRGLIYRYFFSVLTRINSKFQNSNPKQITGIL